MAWTASIGNKRRQGFNLLADITFTDGTTPLTEAIGGNNLASDTTVAAYCANRIAMLDAQDAALAAITVGAVTPAPLDVVDTKPLLLANSALSQAILIAQAKQLNDPDVTAALAAVTDAQAQVDSAAVSLSPAQGLSTAKVG